MVIKKTCPECGWSLIVRKDNDANKEFLSCERFDRCQYTEPLPEDIRLQMLGAAMLPGLDVVS